MATFYSPNVVTDGLVLCLDAANARSYPGSGTSWFDLSGNGRTGTLTNGPTFTSNNGGGIVFDGVDDYVTTNNNFSTITNNLFADSGGSWTVSAWFRFPVSPQGTRTGNTSWMIVGRGGGIGGAETFAIFVSSATDTTYTSSVPYYCVVGIRGTKTTMSPASVNTNTWNNATVTWNGSSGAVYWNGQYVSALNIGTAALQDNHVVMGQTGNGNGAHTFEGSISNVTIYNTALSATEVSQNFNALRRRFGV
jgi:hypothetical protein